MDTINTLLIEENPDDAHMLKNTLHESPGVKFEIVHSQRCEEAIEQIMNKNIDVVLLGLNVPCDEVFNCIRKLHLNLPDLPLIVLNGHCDPMTRIQAAKLGVHEYLIKEQMTSDQLIRMIHYAIERKQSEKKLRETQKKYEDIVSFAPIGICQSTPDGKLLTINNTLVLMSGYESNDELLRLNMHDDIYMDKNEINAFIQELEISGVSRRNELRWKKKDGTIIWVVVVSHPIRNTAGHTLYYDNFIREITEQKNAADALKKSEERFRLLIENANDIIYTIDLEGNFISINGAAIKLTGYSLEQALTMNIAQIVSHEYLELVRTMMSKKVGEGDRSFYEVGIISKDGRKILLELNTRLILDDENNPLILGIARDITFRKESEAELERLRKAVNTSLDTIFMTDEQGTFIFVNPKFIEMYGYTSEEVVGKQTPRILQSGQNSREEYQNFWEKILNGEQVLAEWKNKTMDGRSIDIEASVSPILNGGGKIVGFLAIQRDITERKHVEQELIAAKFQAEQSAKLKDAFISNMSHEIRTPLNIISGYAQIIQESFQDQMKEIEPYFTSLQQGSERLIRTVEEILNISRLETGDIVYSPHRIDIAKLLEKIVLDFQPAAAKKSLTLTFQNLNGTLLIDGDENCLTDALSNLLDNAIKYTKKGFVTVLLYYNAEDDVCISIQDSGIGMSEEYLLHLFEPYSQEDIGYSRGYEGIGLGLALVKKYLDLDGAQITVTSKKNVGTTFTINLMQRYSGRHDKIESSSSEKQVPKKINPSLQKNKPKVLVVDDDEQTRQYMRAILKSNFEVNTASDPNEMEKILIEHSIQLILMDISLQSENDGLTLTRELKARKKTAKIPVVAVTGHAFVHDRENALQAGCDQYISKPFRKEQLFQMMNTLLETHK